MFFRGDSVSCRSCVREGRTLLLDPDCHKLLDCGSVEGGRAAVYGTQMHPYARTNNSAVAFDLVWLRDSYTDE